MMTRNRTSRTSSSVSMSVDFGQDVAELTHFVWRIVVHEGGTNRAALLAKSQPFHQARCIHVAVAYADTFSGKFFRDSCRRDFRQIEAQSGYSLVYPISIGDAIYRGSAAIEYFEHCKREPLLVCSDRGECLL